jgi:cell division protein FtsQ
LSSTDARGPVPPAARAAVGIDPRIRARRIEVQRGAGRRRLRRLVDVGLVLAVLAAFVGALRTPLLQVRSLRVTGAAETPAAQVLERSGIHKGQQLVDVHLRSAAAAVAALPWVGRVQVHRSLDGSVAIRVTERTPAALVGEGDGALVVDAEGRILARRADVPTVAAALVRVAGLPGGLTPGAFLPGHPEDALALAQRLGAAVPGAIAEVSVGRELVATLAQGGQVTFGDPSHLPAKLRSLQTVLDEVDLTCLEVMDLRVPASPVLTRRQGCS